MSDPCILKSNKFGLTLQLDPLISFEDLVKAVCTKFASSRDFFGAQQMILETTGRELNEQEASVIIQAIELNSDIKITLLHENNELKDTRMQGKIDRFYTDEIFENAKIVRGSVIKEDVVTSESSLVILGDVKSKATVKAKGNIIVLGSLEGTAYAGYPDNTGCYIVANQLNSKNVQIGSCNGQVVVQDKWSFRVRKSYEEAVGVIVWNNQLLVEPISSGLVKKVKK